MLESPDSTVTAVLGPTNTGKTHYALDRMLARRSGIIGLPLRLLAREIYDKLVALRGPNAVSLVTGEEKIWPARATYHVCTVEAMPLSEPVDFVAIDEVQMCADPDRGHVFTDRLLHARGHYETLFLGAETMRSRIANLVPRARFQRRERFSTLSWTGPKKISRLKPRTAIVAFSTDQVYAIAELIRRQRGGAAVVMGALSPRTRNAQVALYQDGEVDYLVATDAIGMGLNLDIDHVAFAGTSKFDGWRHRTLEPNELAQIAGRAGRFTTDGTFGVTGDAGSLDPEVVQAIEDHRFKPIAKLHWRNRDLQFHSLDALLRSLDQPPDDPDLIRAREAEDQTVLRALAEDPAIRDRATSGADVRRLWDICQIPDFRKVSPAEHADLVRRIYSFVHGEPGCIPSPWLAGQIGRLDRVDGDIDALSTRLAFIRTWTYVANRKGWAEDQDHWRSETRAVEDRLSDALHERLTQRFVDRRTSVLMRRLKQKERLLAEVNDKGEVTAEGQFLGRLDGFRFTVDETAQGDELKTLKSASLSALQAEFSRRADKLYLSPDSEIDVTEQGGLMWGTDAIGKLVAGDAPLSPKVTVFVDDMADPQVAEKVERRLTHWLSRKINALFEPMLAMRDDPAISGLAKGVAFRLSESFGVILRREISDDVRQIAQEDRALLRKHGVRFGQHFIFMPALLKPAPTRMRLLLWSLAQGHDDFPESPPPGHVTVPADDALPDGYYPMAGYRRSGARALRIDMLERLADLLRPMDGRAGFEANQDMLS
ncbi:MAG: helicase-related protein, partial [Pseudomonadota bacterium]